MGQDDRLTFCLRTGKAEKAGRTGRQKIQKQTKPGTSLRPALFCEERMKKIFGGLYIPQRVSGSAGIRDNAVIRNNLHACIAEHEVKESFRQFVFRTGLCDHNKGALKCIIT